MKVSRNFYRSEYACKCGRQLKKFDDGYCEGGFNAVDVILNKEHESIRAKLSYRKGSEVAVRILSGNRCVKHNKDEGGAARSTHTRGIGSDIEFYVKATREPVDAAWCYNIIDQMYPDKYGLKLYPWGVHFDVRVNKWRMT